VCVWYSHLTLSRVTLSFASTQNVQLLDYRQYIIHSEDTFMTRPQTKMHLTIDITVYQLLLQN
jgi:hypothetical protein